MGTVRKSFQTNSLLLKPRLGAVKKPTQDLPEPNYIYGVCNDLEAEGVREVMTHREHIPDPDAINGPDLIQMNRLATIAHIVKAPGIRPFRKNHYCPLPVSQRVGTPPPLPSEKNPYHVYGCRGEKNEDMGKVMKNGYADEWIKLQMFHQHKYNLPRICFIPPKTNKATVMSAHACFHRMHPNPPSPRFVLSKFKNVPHKIDNVQPIPLKRD
ncbi:cilia- and flagella-associated protein 77 [Selaginella moellendorffii]|uniref:cilia- and flagella-associated protein 77 n=1 Tax=Selaginella moellendorffii TaxID=88036 RepID=UPI000D1C9F59|nr:cilia- and flagella-associated protein 77 [Selaginella moellendorffii]|eukprot:XP_024521320.1 cilia- and flagella-associated protein 77 [Selaginella moellendorffii]